MKVDMVMVDYICTVLRTIAAWRSKNNWKESKECSQWSEYKGTEQPWWLQMWTVFTKNNEQKEEGARTSMTKPTTPAWIDCEGGSCSKTIIDKQEKNSKLARVHKQLLAFLSMCLVGHGIGEKNNDPSAVLNLFRWKNTYLIEPLLVRRAVDWSEKKKGANFFWFLKTGRWKNGRETRATGDNRTVSCTWTSVLLVW